jgi:hypothetical protein
MNTPPRDDPQYVMELPGPDDGSSVWLTREQADEFQAELALLAADGLTFNVHELGTILDALHFMIPAVAEGSAVAVITDLIAKVGPTAHRLGADVIAKYQALGVPGAPGHW